tara:strand:+ start:9071 stop:9520 length:450 start_codon:yes stop_codon:yes gene_type:complete
VNILVKVNLANQELRTFEPVPAGIYRVTVDQCNERESSGGNPGIFWLYKVTDVVSTRGSDDGVGLIGKTVPHNTQLNESSLWSLYRTLVALGDNPDELGSEFEVDQDWCEAQIGKECVITTRTRDYQGQPQADIAQMRALNEEEAGALA